MHMADVYKVATVDGLKPGQSMIVDVDGTDIALFNVNGEFFAITNICAHRGGSLAAGSVDNGVVTCPIHGWQFNIKDGSNAMIGPSVSCFETRVEDGNVYIVMG